MLHIHNGDSAANIARRSSLSGEHVAFREALIEGPTPAEFKDSKDAWRVMRAQHLSSEYGVDLVACQLELQAQENKLASFPDHDEVVLWFEHDLFCQVHLIYLLDWFGREQLGRTRLRLICIDKFPGREKFRGLGELTPDELASLFPTRQEVTRGQLTLAASAWEAYCSADPTDLQRLLPADTSKLPFLVAAFLAHLERFPSTKNGLGRIENRALQLIANGAERFSDLFMKFGEAEPVYGFGDAQFWIALRRLAVGKQPLLTVDGLGEEEIYRQLLTPEIARQASFRITETGHAVLNDEVDFVSLSHLDFWLGGVHLSGVCDRWAWDDKTQTIVSS